MEDRAQGQGGEDGPVRAAPLPTTTEVRRRCPGPDGLLGKPDGDGVVLSTAFGDLSVKCDAEAGSSVFASVRPEHVRLEPGSDTLSLGQVSVIETVFQGANRRCHAVSAAVPDQDLLLTVPADRTVRAGQELEIFVRRQDVVVLRS